MTTNSQGYGEGLLLHDFTDGDPRSELGTEWEGFTDRVMGGRSTISSGIVPGDEGYLLRLSGRVSLENNGGFIQVRLMLAEDGGFDAEEYSGIAVVARRADGGVDTADGGVDTADAAGKESGGYYLHLRTPRTLFPWAHYAAPLPVGRDWREVRVPFTAFEPKYMMGGGKANLRRLRSLAIVAAWRAFDADLRVRRVGFYK